MTTQNDTNNNKETTQMTKNNETARNDSENNEKKNDTNDNAGVTEKNDTNEEKNDYEKSNLGKHFVDFHPPQYLQCVLLVLHRNWPEPTSNIRRLDFTNTLQHFFEINRNLHKGSGLA